MTTVVSSNPSSAQPSILSTGSPTFRQRSRDAARRFLQTVVVIDDQARFKPTTIEEAAIEAIEETREMNSDSLADGVSDDSGIDDVIDGVDILEKPDDAETQVAARHELDAQRLISCFAGEGLVCAVLRPDKNTLPTVLGETARAAQRADVVIVDWQILDEPKDNGKHALQLIQNILAQDQESDGRLRLFIVYTGETDVNDIAGILHRSIFITEGKSLALDAEKPILSSESLRIVVLAKESSKAIPQAKVTIDELPSRILDEFSEMTGGLVPNSTLVSLSVIREKTHTILQKMHKGLDAPFLTHRALIPTPDDAGELLVELIASELHSIIDQCHVSQQVDIEIIGEWMKENHPQNDFKILGEGNRETSVPENSMKNILEKGKKVAFEENLVSGLSKTSVHQKLTYAFCRSTEKDNAVHFDEEFAMLTTLRTRYGANTPPPILSLGVILSKKESVTVGEEIKELITYWLCVQPPCDSIRLKGETAKFPLLPLTPTDKDFHLIIPGVNSAKSIRLIITDKLAECDIVKFRHQNGCVTGQAVEGHFVFQSLDGTYQWVAELKFARAQSTLNDLSAELSRVGTNISEWLRILKPKKTI